MTLLNDAQVGEAIRLSKAGHSQKQIAEVLNTSQATISRYLSGAVIPSFSNKNKRAIYFPESHEKICAKCGAKKSADYFYKHSDTNDGWHSWCKACCKAGDDRSRAKKYSTIEGRISTFLRTCKISAKKRKQKCSLTKQMLINLWAKQGGRCFYSGIEMTTQPAENRSVSIERSDSSIGYIEENTVFVCNAINRMKSDLSLKDFLAMCKAVSEYQSASSRGSR